MLASLGPAARSPCTHTQRWHCPLPWSVPLCARVCPSRAVSPQGAETLGREVCVPSRSWGPSPLAPTQPRMRQGPCPVRAAATIRGVTADPHTRVRKGLGTLTRGQRLSSPSALRESRNKSQEGSPRKRPLLGGSRWAGTHGLVHSASGNSPPLCPLSPRGFCDLSLSEISVLSPL